MFPLSDRCVLPQLRLFLAARLTPWLTLRRITLALVSLGLLTLTTHTRATRRPAPVRTAGPRPAARSLVLQPRPPAPPTTATPLPQPETTWRVRQTMLPASLHAAWQALGNRLAQGGRERLTATGTLRWGTAPPVACQLQQDLSGQLQVLYQQGAQPRLLTYDGQTVRGTGAAVTPAEYALVEMLALDGAESLLLGQARGDAGRTLGRRFHDAASGTPYDVFETAVTLNLGAGTQSREKSYCFHSTTHLLARVRYRVPQPSGHGTTAVEVRYPSWTTVEGQRLPQRVERWEDNVLILGLEFTDLRIGPGSPPTPVASG